MSNTKQDCTLYILSLYSTAIIDVHLHVGSLISQILLRASLSRKYFKGTGQTVFQDTVYISLTNYKPI